MINGNYYLAIAKRLALTAGASTLAMALWTTGGSAQNLVTDPNFNVFTTAPNASWSELGRTGGSPSVDPQLTNWAVPGSGISCVVSGPTITTGTAICGTGYGGNTGNSPSYATLWAVPSNSLPAAYLGNIIVSDGGPGYQQTITQTVSGLTAGKQYTLSFYQAAGQQAGYTGAWTDWWDVSFVAGSTPSYVESTNMAVPSQGVDAAGWEQSVITFTATAASQTLTFFAASSDTSSNEPPMLLLADVSLTKAPEPATLALLGAGFAGLIGLRKRARRTA